MPESKELVPREFSLTSATHDQTWIGALQSVDVQQPLHCLLLRVDV
ncbi:hypothetical protein D9613_010279 [Agrocybe pediades]|uniref:Uncharacterized protein n=1 Tax=Agrocybe pediades TaxID=84607 RepID=A0A8H4QFS6_9AGAR|nr:hypothetical protein D9613_010279 [Agrocybe pediades]